MAWVAAPGSAGILPALTKLLVRKPAGCLRNGSVSAGWKPALPGKILAAACLHFFAVSAAIAAPAASGDTNSHRIVSLAPSDTELVYSVGAQGSLVAVSTYCDIPPEAKALPKAGTFVSANFERLARLKPECVLLVSGQEALAGNLEHQHFKALVLPNYKLSQISANLRTIGKLTDRSPRADALAASFDKALADLSRLVGKASSHPRVFYCVWPEPLLTAGGGSFLNDVITAAGGTNIGAGLKAPYPHFSVEKLVVSQPEVIVMPYEAEHQAFLGKPPWNALKAFRKKKAFFLPAPANDNLSRPTLRILDGLYWLAVRLHPELESELMAWHKVARSNCQ